MADASPPSKSALSKVKSGVLGVQDFFKNMQEKQHAKDLAKTERLKQRMELLKVETEVAKLEREAAEQKRAAREAKWGSLMSPGMSESRKNFTIGVEKKKCEAD